tara:strand:+ start:22652 stop:26701 length:4050 start_codon:yes stop_codon:yes gene_type:complete
VTDANLKIRIDSSDVKAGKVGLDDLAQSGANAEQSTKRLSNSTQVLTSAVRALVASYAVLKTVQYAKDAALLAARYETLGVVMNVVGRNAGYTSGQMNDAVKSMEATGISMLEARQQATKLVQAHIDLSNASKLARIAQDAAVIGNMNSSEAFASMIHGIQTGQTRILRTIGLNISMEQSYQKMADTLGITTSQLDQTQKSQAIINSVMERGVDIAGSYEAAMDTAGKQLNSMVRYQENLKLKIGETFNELLIISVMGFTSALKDANGELDEMAANGEIDEWMRSITDGFATLADYGKATADVFTIIGLSMAANFAMTKALLRGDFQDYANIADEYILKLNEMEAGNYAFSRALEDRRAAQDEGAADKAAAEVLADHEAEMRHFIGTVNELTEAELEAQRTIEEFIVDIQKENDVVGKTALELAIYEAALLGVDSTQMAVIATILLSTEAKQAEVDATEEATEALLKETEATEDFIADLEFEMTLIGETAKEKHILNELRNLGANATEAEIDAAREMIDTLYEEQAAIKAAERATRDLARETERSNRRMQREWDKTRVTFGETFADLVQDGEDAFDALLKSFERMLLEMAGQELFGAVFGGGNFGNAGGGGTSGAASGVTSAITSGLISGTGTSALLAGVGTAGSSLAGAAGFGSLSTTGGWVAPSMMPAAGGTGVGLGSTLTSAIAAIPVWGWALLAAGAAAAILNNDDGKVRMNAGFMVGDTPALNGSDRAFDVDAFESGLNVTGFARRAEQDKAVEVIDTFRDIDSAFTTMIKELDGTIDLSKATLAGLDEEATAGSSGTFLGLGGNGGLGGDIDAQLDMFIAQLVDHVGGLSDELMVAIQSASGAEEVFALLADELLEVEEAAKVSEAALKERNRLQDQYDKLTMTNIELLEKQRDALDESNRALFDSISHIQLLAEAVSAELSLKGALQSAASALRAVGDEVQYLQENADSAANDVQRAQERINDLNRQSAVEMRAFAKTIDEFLITLSPASFGKGLEALKAQLTETASAAAGGDLDAQARLLTQASQVIQSAESSSSTRSDFFRQEAFVRTTLLGVRDAVQAASPANDPVFQASQTPLEIAQNDLAAAKATKELADSALQSGLSLTASLTLLATGPMDDLLSALEDLDEANALVSESALELVNANFAAGLETKTFAELMALTNIEMLAFLRTLSQRNAAAQRTPAENLLAGIEVDNDYAQSEVDRVVAGLNSGTVTVDQVAKNFGVDPNYIIEELARQNDRLASLSGIAGFANGGDFSGGLRLVGENGPELEATGPSRIRSNSETRSLLTPDNTELVAELRAMRIELARLQSSNDVTAAASERTRQLLEQITFGDLALNTVAA